MKVILVPVAGRPECQTALKQAFGLARTFEGNVIGSYLREGGDELRAGKAQLRIIAGKTHTERRSRRKSEALAKAAHKIFFEHVEKNAFTMGKRAKLDQQYAAFWHELSGDPDKLFPIVGPVADLSVVSRPKSTARGRGKEFMLSAVLHSGKPVLVVPQQDMPIVGRNILIAWDQSVDAARAVSAALPLLKRAESVIICSCGPENQPGPKSTSLAQYLRLHGIKSERFKTKGRKVASELEQVAKTSQSDLIVLGAYSRNRMAEIWFGGVTEHMLFNANHAIFTWHS